MERILPILGMHRSGTSLAASQLMRSGVFIGDNLLQGDISNPEGHFEDLEFLTLHKDIFRRHGYQDMVRAPGDEIRFIAEDKQRAHALITARHSYAVWGWKDPRSCNCLGLWLEVLPLRQCVFVIIIRHPAAVVDSLIQRDYYNEVLQAKWWNRGRLRKAFTRQLLSKSSGYLNVWKAFYHAIDRKIIQAGHAHFVATFDDLSHPDWVRALAAQYGLPLDPVATGKSPSQLHSAPDYPLDQHELAGAEALFFALGGR